MFQKIMNCFPFDQGIGALLGGIKDAVRVLGDRFSVKGSWVFLIACVVAVVAGVFGYKLIKLWTALFSGVIGYKAGLVFFNVLATKSDVFAKMSPAVGYVFGVILALGLAVLGFFKFSYVWYTASGLAFGVFFYGFVESKFVVLATILLFGCLCLLGIKLSTVVISSLFAGFLFVGSVSGMMPHVEWLQLGSAPLPLVFALVFAVCFAFVQFAVNKKKA